MTSLDHFLIDASLRAAVVLAIAACIALGLAICRRSAAVRHWIWSLGLSGSLAVPALMAVVPTLSIPMPGPESSVDDAVLNAAEAPAPSHDLLVWAAPLDAGVGNQPATVPEPSVQASALVAANVTAPPSVWQMDWIIAVWALGASLGLLPLLLGVVSLWRLRGRSVVVAGGPLLDALMQATAKLGMARSATLLVTAERSMPMTWGIWQPKILLPANATSWPRERLDMVLLHELAHVSRRDCLAQLLGQVARACYWFNPLAWYAERCLRIEQERACDDLVISCGATAPDYAQQLLSVAASCLPARHPAIALAMACPSRLEQRLLSILDGRQERQVPSRSKARIAAAVAVALSALISVVNFQRSAEAQNQKSAEQAGAAIQAADRTKTVAELRSLIAKQYVKPVNDGQILQGAIKGMVQSLGDPYSDYLTPESLQQMEKQIAGNLTGIGAQLEMHEKQVRVVTPLPGSPALKAGVLPGDVLLEIDGQPTAGIELAEAVKRIVGPAGSNIRLAISRQGGQKLELSVTRGSITLPTIRAFQSTASGEPDYMLDPGEKVGYLQVDQLGAEAPKEMRAAVQSLKTAGMKGLILDLRTCPGGLLDSAVGVAKLFLSGGTIVTIQRRNGETTEIKADAGQPADEYPLVVLVGGHTASAAEVLVGALKDNRRALVLGTRTHGKGSIQTLIKLDDAGGAVKLTTSEYRLPSGRNIDKRPGEKTWGIDPDEGYFVTFDRSQAKAMDERRQARHVIGGKADVTRRAAVTPTTLEQQEHDLQLSAALKTLNTRLQTGSFTKVSALTPAQIEQFLKRDEIEQRREVAAKNLEKIDQELAALSP